MAVTVNFEWSLPTPGGSAGVWGTELNDAFQAVDTSLQAAVDAADAADAALDAAKLARAGGLMTGPVRNTLVDLGTISGSNNINLNSGNVFRCTLSGSTTFAFTNAPSSTEPIFVALEIDASGQDITWPTITWDGGAAPTLSTGANVIVLMIRGTTVRGVHAVKP